MEQSSCQTLGQKKFPQPFCNWLQNWVYFRMPTLQVKWSERLRTTVRWNVVYFRKPHVCSTQLHRSRNYLNRRWSKIGRNQFVGHRNWCVGASSGSDPMHNIKSWKAKSLVTDKRLTDSVDYAGPNSSQWESLFALEVNDAVIKMIITGLSPSMKHISRTIPIKYDYTSELIADSLTKGSVTCEAYTSVFSFYDTTCALLQPFFGVFIFAEWRHNVAASSRTCCRMHRQTKAHA